MKNEAGLRPMKRGFATRKGNTALCFMFAKQTLHGNEVAASYLQSKCFISKDGASLTKHWIYAVLYLKDGDIMANDKLSEQSMDFAVQIINLVKQLREQRESILSNRIGRRVHQSGTIFVKPNMLTVLRTLFRKCNLPLKKQMKQAIDLNFYIK